MDETHRSVNNAPLALIEPDDRVIAIARSIQTTDPDAESVLKESAASSANLGEACLGRALYRHRTIFKNASDAPVWSHLELSYFRGIVPANAILELVVNPQPAGVDLLRAEILLTTPSSFIMPRDWRGIAERPERQASLEFLHVQPKHLGRYRDAMREYCGPAAAKLVSANKFGTFRAMETVAVIHQATEFGIDWNQIHLCELDPDGFEGFGKEFEAALRKDLPEGAEFPDTFASLGRLRTIPRWTFNDPVVEADIAVAQEGSDEL